MSKPLPCPCRDCTERWVDTDALVTCRAGCERHALWAEQEHRKRQKIQQEREVENRMHDHYKALAKRLYRNKRG